MRPLDHQAEWYVHWDMLIMLESTLTGLFMPDCSVRSERTRDVVRGKEKQELT